MRVITADARTVSGADFVKMFAPRQSELDRLCSELFRAAMDGDREMIRSLRAEIASLNDEPLSELKNAAGWL
jgi:hypothetical protein